MLSDTRGQPYKPHEITIFTRCWNMGYHNIPHLNSWCSRQGWTNTKIVSPGRARKLGPLPHPSTSPHLAPHIGSTVHPLPEKSSLPMNISVGKQRIFVGKWVLTDEHCPSAKMRRYYRRTLCPTAIPTDNQKRPSTYLYPSLNIYFRFKFN